MGCDATVSCSALGVELDGLLGLLIAIYNTL